MTWDGTLVSRAICKHSIDSIQSKLPKNKQEVFISCLGITYMNMILQVTWKSNKVNQRSIKYEKL